MADILRQRNKRTGEVRFSTDGGLTWNPGGGVQTRPADPSLPDKRTITHNQATASQYAPGKAAAETTISQAQAANALAIAQANRDKAIADAKTAQIDASGGRKLDPAIRSAALQGYSYANQLQGIVDDLQTKFNAGPGATSGLEGLKDYLPYTANQQFDRAGNAARGIVGQALGFTGGQLNTEREAVKAVGPYLPQSADRDSVIVDKIQQLQDLANQKRKESMQVLGGEPDASGNIVPPSQAPLQQPADPAKQLAGGSKTRSQIDPVLKATGQRVGAMIARGVPDDKIVGFLQQSGVDPASTNIGQILQFRRTPDFKTWLRANPGKAYDVGPQFYTKEIPMSAARRVFNKTAQGDIAGSALAGLAASANAIGGDRLGSMVGAVSGDPQAAQTGMQLLRTNHPIASFGGDLAGQASLEALAGLVPGAQGLMATKLGRRGADVAYGAYSGSGDSADDAGSGGVLGGLLGGATGMAGRGIQKGLGNTLTGVRDAGLQYLHGKKIPLTIGQIARGIGNIGNTGATTLEDELGKGVAGVEERLMGFPGAEAFVKTARQRGDVGFNKAMFRDIAPNVTGTGEAGLTSAKEAENAAYAKLKDARLAVSPEFEAGVSAVGDAAKGLDHHAGDVASVVNDVRSQINSGEMTGKGYQTALQAIRKTRATLNDDVGGKAGAALTDLEQHVLDLGAKQGGTLGKDLAEANAIHARRQIVKQALKSSVSQRAGEMVAPTTVNQAAISGTEKFGGLDRALSSERPFYDLTSNAMKAMPSLTPDPGTAGRMALLGVLGAAGGGLGSGIGALTGEGGGERSAEGGGMGVAGGLTLGALLAAPYSHAGQKIIQKALLGNRPRNIQRLGDFLIANPRLAGLLGQATGRDYFQQQELPQ
jgi:hypothetical protein